MAGQGGRDRVTHFLRKQAVGHPSAAGQGGDRITHLRKQAIGRPSAAGHGVGSGHSHATKADHRAPVSGRSRRERSNHSPPTKASHRAPISAGQGGGISSHSRHTIAGHQALVSSRASRGIGSLTSYESRPVSGRPRPGIRSLTCYESRPPVTRKHRPRLEESNHSRRTIGGHRAPVSGRPRRRIESLTSYGSRSLGTRPSAADHGGGPGRSPPTIAGHPVLVSDGSGKRLSHSPPMKAGH